MISRYQEQTHLHANARFEQLTTEYLTELYAAQPVMATAMGVHVYDDQLPDYNRFAIDAALRRDRAYLYEIDKLSLVRMTRENRIDYRLARASIQMAICSHEQVRPLERQPSTYINEALYGLYLLIARDFADPETRAESLLARLRGMPAMFAQARENLRDAPRIFVEVGLEALAGSQAFLEHTLPAFTGGLASTALQSELHIATAEALETLRDFGLFLREALLPEASEDFAIGPELFDYMLRVGHLMEETGEDLLEIGRQALEDTRCEMARVSAAIDSDRTWQEVVTELKGQHPAAGELLGVYEQEMRRAREFVELKRLLTIPEGETLAITPTPAFARAVMPYAGYMPPAPFEDRQAGLFWVTPVDGSLSVEEQEIRLRGHSRFAIPNTAVHEGYPGHHLQLTCANLGPSRFRRHFGDSNLFAEGWALYCEELMYAEGYYTDPRVRLMQLKDQLWRACRVIVDVELHARRMTVEEAVRFLVEQAELEEPNASAEVKRYVLQPTQPMSYWMGKRAIQSIRNRIERRQGARFDLRRFHDNLLAYGTIPPRLVQDDILSS